MRFRSTEFTLNFVKLLDAKSAENYLLGICLTAAFAATIALNRTSTHSTNQIKFLSPPPEYVEYFDFGFKDSMADSFWLRWIQDSDVCQVYDNREIHLTNKITTNDPLVSNPRHKNCDGSWGFKMLDSVAKLSPRFEMIYLAGAPTLSILVEDFEGASKIYEKGLSVYPNNWKILYRAAYHYQFDRQNLTRAAELLTRAGENGAPFWVRSLAARLYTAAGQYELGISTLEEYRKTLSDEKSQRLVDERIAELKRKLQP